jgi:hypothetical protein
MSEIAEKYIRSYAQKNKILFSKHALTRMMERKIEIQQVRRCIIEGKIIEVQDSGNDIKVLFQEASKGLPSFYTVVVATLQEVIIVSVCLFKEEIWEYIEGFMKRRNHYGQ